MVPVDRSRSALVVVAASAALAIASPVEVHAGAPDSYGLGSRSSAMAGAVGADARDFSAGFYNPAGLAEAPAISIAVGYGYNFQRLTTNGKDNDVDDVHGIHAGVVAPGKLWGIPFAFGLALFLPDSGISFLKARKQEVPRWELYDTRQQLLFLAANLALRPLRWLEIGGGIGYLSATRGNFAIRGRAEVATPFDSQLEHEVDADLTAVRFPIAGIRLLLERWGALGVSYRGESKLDLELGARLEGAVRVFGIVVPLLYQLEARTINSFTPHTLTWSLSFQRIERLHLNLDVSWIHWSSYVSPVAQIRANLHVEPPPGTPAQIPESPAQTAIVPPSFRDRLAPRVGGEYRVALGGGTRKLRGKDAPLLELPLRLGYAYDPSPVPEQTGVTTFIDSDRHTMTVGAGLHVNAPSPELSGTIAVDVHGLFSHLPKRTTIKENPADFVGDFTAGGAIYGVGGSVEVSF
jgi:long-chain fatty acid transport protein